MITITFVLIVLAVLGVVACCLPIIALPLLDILVGTLIVLELVKLIKRIFKKKDKA